MHPLENKSWGESMFSHQNGLFLCLSLRSFPLPCEFRVVATTEVRVECSPHLQCGSVCTLLSMACGRRERALVLNLALERFCVHLPAKFNRAAKLIPRWFQLLEQNMYCSRPQRFCDSLWCGLTWPHIINTRLNTAQCGPSEGLHSPPSYRTSKTHSVAVSWWYLQFSLLPSTFNWDWEACFLATRCSWGIKLGMGQHLLIIAHCFTLLFLAHT